MRLWAGGHNEQRLSAYKWEWPRQIRYIPKQSSLNADQRFNTVFLRGFGKGKIWSSKTTFRWGNLTKDSNRKNS